MSAFVLVHGTPIDLDKLKRYSALAQGTFAAFGAQIIAKGAPELLTGSLDAPIAAVIQFPDADSARRWYASPDYQALIPLRDEGLDCSFVLVGD